MSSMMCVWEPKSEKIIRPNYSFFDQIKIFGSSFFPIVVRVCVKSFLSGHISFLVKFLLGINQIWWQENKTEKHPKISWSVVYSLVFICHNFFSVSILEIFSQLLLLLVFFTLIFAMTVSQSTVEAKNMNNEC